MKELNVKATLITDILGSQPGDPELHSRFIASKAPDAMKMEEEIAAMGVEAIEERSMTYFHRDKNGDPCLMDYQIKGFFKSAAKVLNKIGGTEEKLEKLKAFKQAVDLYVFIYGDNDSRFIPFKLPEGGEIGSIQRPLRASTMQGERITLATSETLPAGSELYFKIVILDDSLLKYVREWLDYGKYNGLGQWRNASYGRFTWEEV